MKNRVTPSKKKATAERIEVRQFRMNDYPDVASLWHDAGLEFRPGDEPRGIRVKSKRDPEFFLVAENEKGTIVGTVIGGWDGRRGWIYHLGVSPSHQRRGVATMMLAELERRMKRKGVVKVNGIVFPWNQPSLRCFQKNGYSVQDIKEVGKQLIGPRKERRN
jgi:ribosomal protein S18 acetylase RimI-like enzyme